MYVSQYGQDEFLDKKIFKGFMNGFFVDVGAHDGVSINNTICFEKEYGWTGINIEPVLDVYDKLQHNRPNCININVAIDKHDGETEFIMNEGYTEMLSGISEYYEPEHKLRLTGELLQHGGKSTVIKVPTKRLETIFEENNITHVHLLSVDVEGAEVAVVESIHFDKVFIDAIVIEDNYKTRLATNYLSTKGYIKVAEICDDFLIHRDSQFIKNLIG
jgi:FkbM family methyltransferase